MKEVTYEIDSSVKPWTVELDPVVMILSFHSRDQLQAWLQGQPMKLINHWIKEAPAPRHR